MPGRKKKTTEEPKPVQNSSNCPEQENNPDNPGGPIKCSCPMGKHPNNSRTCNKKKSKQNSKKIKKMDSDSDSDFEPDSKLPKMSPLPQKTKVTKKPVKKPTKKSSPIPSQAPTAILDENSNMNILTALKSLQHGSKCRQSFGLESCARSVIVNKLKEFCISLCREQESRGRYYLFEQPASASSWDEDCVKQFLSDSKEAILSTGHMCRFGMTTPSKDGQVLYVRKLTRWLTNSMHIAKALALKCEGGMHINRFWEEELKAQSAILISYARLL